MAEQQSTIPLLRAELAKFSPNLVFDDRRKIEEALLDVAEAAERFVQRFRPNIGAVTLPPTEREMWLALNRLKGKLPQKSDTDG